MKTQNRKNTVLIFAVAIAAIALSSSVHAATVVTVERNINTFLTSGGNASGQTDDVLFDAGSGNTVTLRITTTTQSGEVFSNLDGGQRVGVGAAATDSFHVEDDEDITFDVDYLSHTGNIDPSSIAFRFDQIGIRNSNTNNVYDWIVNASVVQDDFAGVVGETYRTLDTSFTTIGTSTTAYAGTLDLTNTRSGTNQLTRNVGGGLRGLQFSVSFAPPTAPEPSTFVLAALSMCGMGLVRRRRRG